MVDGCPPLESTACPYITNNAQLKVVRSMGASKAWFIATWAAHGLCFIPEDNMCSTCPVAADTDCIYQGEAKPCYTNVNACCADTNMSVEVGDCLYRTCERFAAMTEGFTNEQCQKQCMAGESGLKDFTTNCGYQHFFMQDGVIAVNNEDCYNTLVHGYSGDEGFAGYYFVDNVNTPALCQAVCQRDQYCSRFLWTSPLMVPFVDEDDDKPYRCALKDPYRVDTAYNQYWTANGTTVNGNKYYCPYSAKTLCVDWGRQCLQCNGEDVTRCVWPSEVHITGNRNCANTTICRPKGAKETNHPVTDKIEYRKPKEIKKKEIKSKEIEMKEMKSKEIETKEIKTPAK